jgi:NADPH-dependent 2,4-dienoyl-CoA reductase/sulfur reductase-like enzyme
VHADGGRLRVEVGSDHSGHTTTRTVDQVVADHGTRPNADLYFDLKAGSSNLGEVDYDALINGRPQEIVNNSDGTYRLFRIGDAVTSRDIHAAIYDALRLMKDV